MFQSSIYLGICVCCHCGFCCPQRVYLGTWLCVYGAASASVLGAPDSHNPQSLPHKRTLLSLVKQSRTINLRVPCGRPPLSNCHCPTCPTCFPEELVDVAPLASLGGPPVELIDFCPTCPGAGVGAGLGCGPRVAEAEGLGGAGLGSGS